MASERWKLYGASHALVIGIDEYSAGWPRLSNAVKDAESVAAELEARGFAVTLLLNSTGDQLRSELRNFFAFKGADPEARLFVWFAGHGYTEFGEGYLVPADAPDPSEPAFRAVALHMGDVGSMVRIARSKHVYAVFDSCFAGTIFNASRARPPAAITRAVSEPVRQFLTSGDADQEVSDDGSFRQLFLKALNGDEDADANDDGYLTGTELSLYLEDRVINLTNALQTPRSGKLRDQRFDQGDFVFLLPQPEEVQVASANPEPEAAAGTRALPSMDRDLAVELAFWDSIKSSDSIADYQAYLGSYPEGQFAPLAVARIAELEARVARLEAEQARLEEEARQRAEEEERRRAEEEARRQAEAEVRRQEEAERATQLAALPKPPEIDPAEQAELALNLNRNDRRELQAALTALGFDTNGVDGFFGPGTRAAIQGYQGAKGAERTGYLTASLASSIVAEAPKPEPAPQPVQQAAPQPAQTQTAALPPEPAVSEAEINGYIDSNESALRSALENYNDQHRIILRHSGSSTLSRTNFLAWRVVEISGSEAVVGVSYQHRAGNASGGGTQRFLMKWTGSALEFIGYEKDREMRRTGG
ncbi:MAG: caspase family protein [Rhodovibrionaceae bacterium]